MNIGEFFIKLGVVSDEGKVKQFSAAVNQGVAELKALSISAVAAIYSVNKMVDDLVMDVVALTNFNHQTGLSIEMLNKWQKAAKLSDVSLTYEQIAQNVKSLQSNLTELQFGGGNTQAFRFLGIDVTGMDAFEVLENVREHIKDIDNVTATNLIKKMGLTPNFINVLKLSRQEFEKLGKSGFLTEEQRDKAIKVGTALTKLKIELKEIKDRIAVSSSDHLIRLFERFGELARGVENFVNKLQNSEAVLMTFQGLLIIIAGVFAPITTAVVIAALAIEDLWVALNGGDSVTMEVLKMISDPEFWKWGLDNTIEWLQDMWNWLLKIGDAINNAGFDAIKSVGRYFGIGVENPAEKLRSETSPGAGVLQNGGSYSTIANTYHIASNGNGDDVAEQIAKQQTRQLNSTFDEMLGGTL